MEAKRHTSSSYQSDGSYSRISQDLQSCSKDFLDSAGWNGATRKRVKQSSHQLRVGVIGAGLAGLRCAEVLLDQSNTTKVTILEARESIGGRPSWLHGTDNNPIIQLAKASNTLISLVDDSTIVFGPEGDLINHDIVENGFKEVEKLIAAAFKYSNENCDQIAPHVSLADFFRNKLSEKPLLNDEDSFILQLAELWGGFIGDSWEKQSLKFWLEECLDGDNLFVTDTHHAIIHSVAKKALEQAEIRLSTKVECIESVGT
ncbi:flavin containing amine oxidase protein [Rutstroemia sp. NJR-2017a WRK4]|nr:flavin containing amine oxidase protein [Rutstroemia sp. NJR-2017a WRK4]